jgi:Tol biopolymer transport system component
MPRRSLFMIACAVGVSGCLGDPPGTDFDPNAPLPALEVVPHQALGSSRIAFHRVGPQPVRYAGIYWIDGATGSTGGGQSGVTDPNISPDGGRTAFRAPSGTVSQFDVWVSGLSGTNHQRLTELQGVVEGPPSWTPGSEVIYPLYGSPVRIMVQPPLAGSVADLIASVAPPAGEPCPHYAPGDGPIAMSNTGALLFTCQWRAIYRISAGTTTPVAVYTRPEGMANIRQAVWSPDEQRIAFVEWLPTEQTTAGYVRVHVIDADGRNLVTLSTVSHPAGMRFYGDQSVASLCWSADGSTIVFTAPEGDLVSRIFAVPAGGGTTTKITSAAGTSDGSVSCTR